MKQPDEYQIRTVQDFMQVPKDKRDACLADFKHYLEFMDQVEETNQLIRGLTGGLTALTPSDAFHWVDDDVPGLTKINITFDAEK